MTHFIICRPTACFIRSWRATLVTRRNITGPDLQEENRNLLRKQRVGFDEGRVWN